MDMASASGPAGFLINAHSWYDFVTTADGVGAGPWCATVIKGTGKALGAESER
jgi:hypothetical protein